jgi:hypothetical protein
VSQTTIRDLSSESLDALSARLSPGAQVVLQRLAALLDEDEEDDYGVLRPTPYALDTAVAVIVQASQSLRDEFPAASVSTDHRAGCRIRWRHGGRRVHLFIPHAEGEGSYIYHQEADDHSTEKDVSASSLVHWLGWLVESNRSRSSAAS